MKKLTKSHKEQKDAGCWIKHSFFFYLLPFLLLQTDKLWRREQSDSNKSTLLPIYKQISLTTTNKRGAAKEEARRTAFGNH